MQSREAKHIQTLIFHFTASVCDLAEEFPFSLCSREVIPCSRRTCGLKSISGHTHKHTHLMEEGKSKLLLWYKSAQTGILKLFWAPASISEISDENLPFVLPQCPLPALSEYIGAPHTCNTPVPLQRHWGPCGAADASPEGHY